MSDFAALLTAIISGVGTLTGAILGVLGFLRAGAKERREAAVQAAAIADSSRDDEQERQIRELREQLEKIKGTTKGAHDDHR